MVKATHFQYNHIAMLELSQRNESRKFASPLLSEQQIIRRQNRRCTDTFCLILFLLFFGAFVGILIYGCVTGDLKRIFGVYNPNQVRCQLTNYPYGYFSNPNQLKNVACVSTCPTTIGQTIPCLNDGVTCNGNSLVSAISTFKIAFLCVPDVNFGAFSLSTFFDYNIYEQWSYDLRQGYFILIAASVLAIVASVLFLLFVRCCAGIVIWIVIFIAIVSLLGVGVLFILESQGIKIAAVVDFALATLSQNSMIIIGSVCLALGVLMLLVVCCLRNKINMGSKSVEMAAIYLVETCYIALVPLIQAILIVGTLAAIIVGAIYIYSNGNMYFVNNDAFATVYLTNAQIILISFLLAGGLWTVFWIHGSNHFILCSSASIWYFNNHSNQDLHGSPLCDSVDRLFRYHSGTVAFCSLLNGIFFILKILAQILSMKSDETENQCIKCCYKCMNCFLCCLNIFLRFLSDGTYVQVAIFGTGYCKSTLESFEILTSNAIKISLTDGISIFFTILGVIGISCGVGAGAYFCSVEIIAFANLLTDPVPVTVVSTLIAFVISCIFLSMIDMSAQSIIQCYIIDHQRGIGSAKYCRQNVKQLLVVVEP